MHRNKINDMRNAREEDMEFAQRVNDRLRKELEDEKDRNDHKRRIYLEAIKNQLDDQRAKDELDEALRKESGARRREMMINDADEDQKKLWEERNKNNRFAEEIKK